MREVWTASRPATGLSLCWQENHVDKQYIQKGGKVMQGGRKHSSVPAIWRAGRRAAVIAQTAVCLTTMVGFAALAIDVGHMYKTRAELQRTADAAALAAAAELGDYTAGNPLERARAVAIEYAARNAVLGEPVVLDGSDVIFGRSYISPSTGKYVFEPTEINPNAIRVRARRTQGSPSGPVPLYLASIFGIPHTNVSAAGTAVLTPRDIALVLDLSASHNDDSSLIHFRLTTLNNRDVWAHLWDSSLLEQPHAEGLPGGPTIGNMRDWGSAVTGPGWNFASDGGLVRLKRGTAWALSSAWASQTLEEKGFGSYTATEMSVINAANGAGTETTPSNSTQRANYRRRVRVALGLDRWKSGKPGGQPGGNGDNIIDAGEVAPMIPYPSAASNPVTHCKKVGGNWDGFIDYVSDITKADNITSETGLSQRHLQYNPESTYYGHPDLRWRFGLKLFVDYIQDKYTGDSASPGMRGAPEQPMKAVADGVEHALEIIDQLDGNDLVGMAAYGTQGYGPVEKATHLSWLVDDLPGLRAKVAVFQAGMWSPNTNIAQGIDRGVDVLFDSSQARPNAAKIILLLTDGNANQVRSEPTYWDVDRAYQDTLAAARDARDRGVRIYTISVGADSDQTLMEQVAAIGAGEHFHAAGEIAEYQQQLQDIFQNLGGKRPVALIQ